VRSKAKLLGVTLANLHSLRSRRTAARYARAFVSMSCPATVLHTPENFNCDRSVQYAAMSALA